jgi:selenide,water dikinase
MMSTLNRQASEAMLAAGATAATDVTGYGLIGHLANIKGGADVELRAIPFLDGVRELAEKDLFPSGSRRNFVAYREQVDWGATPELEQMMLCDAQTSGGLLVTVPAHSADRFEDAMHSATYPAARIGAMRDDGSIRVK